MKLEKEVVQCALEGIVEKGDTDIFPYPMELKFFREFSEQIVEELSNIDIQQYRPLSLVESLVPKSRFGFRVAHQPYPVDTVIYTALVIKISDDLETGRDKIGDNRAFSYRKRPGLERELFVDGRSFKDWLDHFGTFVFSDEFGHVVRTDISDFYARIYRHRLENIHLSLTTRSNIVKKIEGFIGDWRSAQSFGIPVGSNASRLLAEIALHDTDMALVAEGIQHTRFVDDYRLFIRKGQYPYAALAFLAKQLSGNEGLALNSQKTQVMDWKEFIATVGDADSEDEHSKEEFATEKLFQVAYGQDEIDEKALEALMLKDLVKELEELLKQSLWDMGKIRIVLHAMRLVARPSVAKYIRTHLQELLPFAKDVCLLIEDFHKKGVAGFENLSAKVVDLLLKPVIQPLDCARSWYLELGVRNLVSFNNSDIRKLETLSGTLDLRQLHIIRWRASDVNYFRARKTRLNEIQKWAQPSFVFGASCLPRDEYNHWIRSIRSRLEFPLGKLFAEWCLGVHGTDPFCVTKNIEVKEHSDRAPQTII